MVTYARFKFLRGLSISRPPALCLAPGPDPGPDPWPPVRMYWPWPRICIYRPWPPICIYQPWLATLLPVRGLSFHIPTLSPQLVFVFTVLDHDLYYRSGAWIWIYLIIGSSSNSSNIFRIDNINISMVILVN